MKLFFKKYCLLFILLCLGARLYAQQNHFIYLQTENKQPFYIKLDKKILSSSASGYLIIPKLQEGSHTLTLGFPKNEWPEQKVTCSIDNKDAGYILKNFGDKGWGLFNWQTMNVVMADKKAEEPVVIAEVKKEDAVVKTIPAVTEPAKTVVAEAPPKETPAKTAVSIIKIVDSKTAEGVEMVFVDWVNGVSDTIRVFIPADKKTVSAPVTIKTEVPKEAVVKEEKIIAPKENPAVAPPLKQDEKKDTADVMNKPALPVIELSVKEKEQPAVTEKPAAVPVKPVIQNSDCKAFATEEDFMKLRKKMAAEDNDDDMVAVARKAFKAKCFTVEQVKNLSVLFLKDEGRYKFFDASYPFVSDSYNFSSLESLLKEEYYITRFKAMLRR
jgi:Domain of unknown function (DUF4476)